MWTSQGARLVPADTKRHTRLAFPHDPEIRGPQNSVEETSLQAKGLQMYISKETGAAGTIGRPSRVGKARGRRGSKAQYLSCPPPSKLRRICESARETSRRETIKSHSCSEGP